jgi:hypothetical protein
MMKLKRRSAKPKPSYQKDVRLKIDELSPDGVRIIVEWKDFVVGASVFIPAIDVVELIEEMRLLASNNKWEIEYRLRVEDGKLGVRFWRTL